MDKKSNLSLALIFIPVCLLLLIGTMTLFGGMLTNNQVKLAEYITEHGTTDAMITRIQKKTAYISFVYQEKQYDKVELKPIPDFVSEGDTVPIIVKFVIDNGKTGTNGIPIVEYVGHRSLNIRSGGFFLFLILDLIFIVPLFVVIFFMITFMRQNILKQRGLFRTGIIKDIKSQSVSTDSDLRMVYKYTVLYFNADEPCWAFVTDRLKNESYAVGSIVKLCVDPYDPTKHFGFYVPASYDEREEFCGQYPQASEMLCPNDRFIRKKKFTAIRLFASFLLAFGLFLLAMLGYFAFQMGSRELQFTNYLTFQIASVLSPVSLIGGIAVLILNYRREIPKN